MLSKKTIYGLLAMMALGRRHGSGPILISDLAEADQIPRKFLEMILLSLKNAGILASRKGKGGGYYLAKAPGEITVGEVIRTLEGPLAPIPCLSVGETAYQRCPECGDEETCGIRMVMKDVRDSTASILNETTFKEVLARSSQAAMKRDNILDFVI